MNSNSFQIVRLDNENKVIRIDGFFYDLKGVLITERPNDSDQTASFRYETYPIVGDDWKVLTNDKIPYGLSDCIIGKKGDILPLDSLSRAIDYCADDWSLEFFDIFLDLEKHEIKVSNLCQDGIREYPDTIKIVLERNGAGKYILYSEADNYYIPQCVMDEDASGVLLYITRGRSFDFPIVGQISDLVKAYSRYFKKPDLRVEIRVFSPGKGMHEIPAQWSKKLQTLEQDINDQIVKVLKNHPEDF